MSQRRIHGDKGYRGHNYPDRFKVWISARSARVTKVIRRDMQRRAASYNFKPGSATGSRNFYASYYRYYRRLSHLA